MGYADTSTGAQHAFLWDPVNGMRDLGTFGGAESLAHGINDRGEVVGQVAISMGVSHAFLWDPVNGMRNLGTFGGGHSAAHGINDRGEVVGYADTSTGVRHAFLWDPVNGMRDLGTLPGGGQSVAHGINDRGEVVGQANTASGNYHAFLWDPVNGMRDLGTLPGTNESRADAINNKGQIAGYARTVQDGIITTDSAILWHTDSDGDGLLDSWEEFGYDHNKDGIIDVDLPAMGANKNHKDIFIEVDYMVDALHSHQPKAAALQTLIDAFNRAPVSNPDGATGIRLHIDAGPNSIMNPATGATWGTLSRATTLTHTDILGAVDLSGNYDWTDFNNIKQANFEAARLAIFHYVVFAHNLGGLGGTSGISRNVSDFSLGASDFIVSLGSGADSVGSTYQQAGTFMHELGHNLSLRHGGGDHFNYKPNYLSIMNYSFIFTGLRINGRDGLFDYSRFIPPNLDENNLNETVGINGGTSLTNYGTRWYCSDQSARATDVANSPIDWNCNGNAIDNPTTANINNGPFYDNGAGTLLISQNDWAKLVYAGGSVGDRGATFADQPMTTPFIDEPDPIELQQILTEPAAPTAMSAADVPTDQGGALNLTWTPSTSAGVIEQRIHRSTTTGGPYTLVSTIAGNTTNTYTDTGLINGTTYYYVVRAFDGKSVSVNSNEASAIPVDNTAPVAPTGLTAADRPNDQGGAITLSWTVSTSTDVTEQRIYRGTTAGGPYTLILTITRVCI